jgi:hypothetical protein
VAFTIGHVALAFLVSLRWQSKLCVLGLCWSGSSFSSVVYLRANKRVLVRRNLGLTRFVLSYSFFAVVVLKRLLVLVLPDTNVLCSRVRVFALQKPRTRM